MTSSLNRETLLTVGFKDVAAWRLSGDDIEYHLDGERAEANLILLEDPNALYAFVRGDAVQYIGKTTRSARKRFVGYRKPGKSQRTNIRCNCKIKELLRGGAEIRILVFTPISDLRYLDFEINLAAGLEDALIKSFDPPWNGRDKGKPISEDEEREEAEEKVDVEAAGNATLGMSTLVQKTGGPLATFKIVLGQAYYQQGLINPGVDASRSLGPDGDPIQILFEDGTEPVVSKINRTANASGAVRVVGHNRQIADWFCANFQLGDSVEAQVMDANRILLMKPPH